ncbi:hypothetical protein QP185_02885 [Sphingomonas aerolata]|uniref:hypothetical protein n=1 Tax=Sphingomonas aerolata TaxID=185951 RepID=UPI002FE2A905
MPSLPIAAAAAAPQAVDVAVQAVAAAAPLKPVTVRATVQTARATDTAIVRAAAPERLAAVAKVRPQAVAMLDRKLLSDNTLGSILSGARAEAGRLR